MAATFRSRNIAERPARRAGLTFVVLTVLLIVTGAARPGLAQTAKQSADHDKQGITPPPGYVIGPGDVLNIVFWRNKDMSTQAVVRPDGRISLPLLDDVTAAGLAPDALGPDLEERAKRYFDAPNVTVIIQQINSRYVYITGRVAKPGQYPLYGPTTVLQLISTAGGVSEYAHKDDIVILRIADGHSERHKFNYDDVVKGKHVEENIALKPGDTVVVP
jgi:polysaccharide export outer membrane protein